MSVIVIDDYENVDLIKNFRVFIIDFTIVRRKSCDGTRDLLPTLPTGGRV